MPLLYFFVKSKDMVASVLRQPEREDLREPATDAMEREIGGTYLWYRLLYKPLTCSEWSAARVSGPKGLFCYCG